MDQEKWSTIIELYQDLKHVTLLAEELEFESFKTFLQPVLEQRSALDHICRAMSSEAHMVEENVASDYVSGNFDKAIGHLYRAFFDAADMLSILLRGRVLDVLEGFDVECITAVCPDYFKEVRPRVEQISAEIAGIRESKDIKVKAAIDDVKCYDNLLDELRGMYNGLLTKVPSFQEYASKQKQTRLFKWLWQGVLVVIGVILGYLLRGS